MASIKTLMFRPRTTPTGSIPTATDAQLKLNWNGVKTWPVDEWVWSKWWVGLEQVQNPTGHRGMWEGPQFCHFYHQVLCHQIINYKLITSSLRLLLWQPCSVQKCTQFCRLRFFKMMLNWEQCIIKSSEGGFYVWQRKCSYHIKCTYSQQIHRFYSKVYALSMQTTNWQEVMNSDGAVLASVHISYLFILHLAPKIKRWF